MLLAKYLGNQLESFVTALNDPIRYPVGVCIPDRSLTLSCGDGSWEWDRTAPPNAGFLRRLNTERTVEYWAHVNFSGYRKTFLSFLREHFGLCPEDISSELHVDHMLHRSFARKYGINYVRLALLHRKQNLSYGSKFEKLLLRCNQSTRDIYLPDYCICLKLFGVPIPRSKTDYAARREEIACQLIAQGLKPKDPEIMLKCLDTYFYWWTIL